MKKEWEGMYIRLGFSEKDLADIYDALFFYITNRYGEYTYEELQVIRHVLDNIKKEYKVEMGDAVVPIQSYKHRNAGRKPLYSEENAQMILTLRKEGIPIQKIAEQLGCSAGRVSSVLRKAGTPQKPSLPDDEVFWLRLDAKRKQ